MFLFYHVFCCHFCWYSLTTPWNEGSVIVYEIVTTERCIYRSISWLYINLPRHDEVTPPLGDSFNILIRTLNTLSGAFFWQGEICLFVIPMLLKPFLKIFCWLKQTDCNLVFRSRVFKSHLQNDLYSWKCLICRLSFLFSLKAAEQMFFLYSALCVREGGFHYAIV